MSKGTKFFAYALIGALALAPALAEAKAGSGSSSGSRGARTHQAPPSTQTAPQTAKPMERSMNQPGTTAPRPAAQPAAPAAQQSWFQRNPFMAGMMGGLIGMGIGGLLFGNGFFNGLSGGAGFLGLLLQIALIGGVIYLVFAFLRRRREGDAQAQGPQPAQAYAGNAPGPMPGTGAQEPIRDIRPLDLGHAQARVGGVPNSGGLGGGDAGPQRAATSQPQVAHPSAHDEIGVGEADYAAFEKLLIDVQGAWSQGDLGKLRRLVTPEMLGYFSEDLSADASRGQENHVEDVKFDMGDLAEAWREGDVDYATVAMKWTARDWTIRVSDGQIVAGDDRKPTETTEIWTFMRAAGGQWILSAIQQVQ